MSTVPFDAQMQPILPLKLPAGVTLLSLGTLVTNNSTFIRDKNEIYPLGYATHRIFHSMRNLGQRTDYISTIKQHPENSLPWFVVTAADARDWPAEGNSPAAVWNIVTQRCNDLVTRSQLNAKASSNASNLNANTNQDEAKDDASNVDATATATNDSQQQQSSSTSDSLYKKRRVSGKVAFALNHPIVQQLITMMPNYQQVITQYNKEIQYEIQRKEKVKQQQKLEKQKQLQQQKLAHEMELQAQQLQFHHQQQQLQHQLQQHLSSPRKQSSINAAVNSTSPVHMQTSNYQQQQETALNEAQQQQQLLLEQAQQRLALLAQLQSATDLNSIQALARQYDVTPAVICEYQQYLRQHLAQQQQQAEQQQQLQQMLQQQQIQQALQQQQQQQQQQQHQLMMAQQQSMSQTSPAPIDQQQQAAIAPQPRSSPAKRTKSKSTAK
jgi:hypothetical protein